MDHETCSVGRQRHQKCEVQYRGVDSHCRSYFCTVHQQWTYEFPISVIYVYADGRNYEKKRR